MMYEKRPWRLLGAAAGVALGLACLAIPVAVYGAGQPRATQQPIEDFLSAQGKYDGSGGEYLFVPPDPNFLGWNSELDDAPIYFAGVDYAALADAYAPGNEPEITGSVKVRALSPDLEEVTVLLHTSGCNMWVIELDLAGDVLDQIANAPTLFGHRPADVLAGAEPALGDAFLHVVFINAKGAPLPDLMDVGYDPTLPPYYQSIKFQVSGQGPLTAEYGVPEGTPGMCTIAQTGLLATSGRGDALEDAFPVENIMLHEVGN